MPLSKGKLDVETRTGRTPHEGEGRDRDEAAAAKGSASELPNLGGGGGGQGPPHSPQRTLPAGIRVSDLQPPDWDNTFLLFKPPCVWHLVAAELAN